ncbi:DUF937 domain-containing protein [Gloeocapsa sp. PCC 73106]|uniref:DUF937 domain-containing protein n=1 Tax=Gloeocapsa sp. PCC 73106 TaxID=102232 RepID=UPI0002AC37B5|nr:DUF937 domain-containing protein [Gloeocapsa sp. PCC 73106]ELR96234.1 Bacterial protein of unknown function (DUF937) [Gloeocapsa sp. PCC 73106]
MGLFFDVLSAINNPNQAASIDQLSQVTNSVNDVASTNGLDPSNMQGVMSSLSGFLRPALQQKMAGGSNPLESMMGQFTGGGGAGLSDLTSLLPGNLQTEMISGMAQKTGLDSSMLQGMLPKLLPAVMGLLNMGKTTGGMGGGNPLLKAFLDSDRDGDVDLGDVFKFSNRFLNPAR